jgi:hypothetical protein
MEPEIIMLSEISQTEKDRYHMFSLKVHYMHVWDYHNETPL